jgi:hypothetical protein
LDSGPQGKGYGKMLIAAALRKFLIIHEQAGSIGLFVDAKDQAAASYYSRFGFERLEEDGLDIVHASQVHPEMPKRIMPFALGEGKKQGLIVNDRISRFPVRRKRYDGKEQERENSRWGS